MKHQARSYRHCLHTEPQQTLKKKSHYLQSMDVMTKGSQHLGARGVFPEGDGIALSECLLQVNRSLGISENSKEGWSFDFRAIYLGRDKTVTDDLNDSELQYPHDRR